MLPEGDPGARANAWHPDDLVEAPAQAETPDAADPLADAYALGFEEGRHEGEVAEQARLSTARRAAEAALDIIRANEERWTDSIDENIIALSTAVARHIVDRELALDSTIVAQLVSRALTVFPIDQPVRIRVNPSDLILLEGYGATALEERDGASPRAAYWVADPRVAPGGCVVEGRDRIVDGRVDTALERVYRRLAHRDA